MVMRRSGRRPALDAAVLGALTLILAAGWSARALAFLPDPSPPPRQKVMYRSLTAAQWNPLGLQSDLVLGYRLRLVKSESLLFRDTFAAGRAIVRLNPAFVRLGVGVALQPMAALTLCARWEHRLYFGSVNMLQSFARADSEYHEDEIARRGDLDLNYAGNGHQVTLQAVLRAKLGPVVLLNDFNMVYFDMNLRRGDKLFYVNMFDTLAPGKGWVLVNHGHLLYLLTRYNLVFGVRYSAVQPLYSDALLADSGGHNPNSPNHRIGPMVAYQFKGLGKRFKQPTLVLILAWWINNRYRSGQWSHQGIPYGVVAFQFTGDLWSK
jgi:hypothetical protein